MKDGRYPRRDRRVKSVTADTVYYNFCGTIHSDGLDKIYNAHRAQTAAGTPLQIPCKVKADTIELSTMADTAAILAVFPITPRSRKARIGGPIFGWSMIFASHTGFDLAKKTAAMMKNTVLGMTGKNIPMIPKAVNSNPTNMRIIRILAV